MTLGAGSATAVAGATTSIELKVGGSVYDDANAPAVTVEVETSLRMPAMATISFRDDDFHKKAKDFNLDADVEIAVVLAETKPLIFKGKISALEARREALNGVTVVRCYDAMAALHGARKTRTFLGEAYGNIVSKIARDAGIETGTVESGPTHDYVAQFEETDWEFLERLAGEYGYLLRMDNEWKLSFGPPPELRQQPPLPSSTTPGTTCVVLGDDLMSYDITYGPKPSAGTVKTAGWDSIQGQAINAQANVAEAKQTVEFRNLTPPAPSGDFLVSTIPFRIVQNAEVTAKGVADQIAGGMASLRGKIMGNPLITAGVELAVGPPENSFAGWYLVTSARHTFDQGQLNTEFVCDGLGDRAPLARGSADVASAAAPPNRIPWAVTGLVTSVKDFDANGTAKLGRVKVKFPTLGWDDANGESDWLRVVTPGAGAERGMWWLPEVGDEVLCVFDRGDMRAGYVLGGVYNGASMPISEWADPATTSDGKVKHRGLATTTGHQLAFCDEDGNESVLLRAGTGASGRSSEQFELTYNQAEGLLTVKVAGSAKSTELTLNGQGQVTITGGDTITFEATTDLVLKGNKVNIEAQTDVLVKGLNVTNEASANFKASGSAMSTVEGATLTLKGSALAELSAGMVKIN